MIDQELQRNLSRAGIIGSGFFGAFFVLLQFGWYLLGSLFLLVAVGGVFLLLNLQNAYSIIMIVVGVLALSSAIFSCMNRGVVDLTAFYLLLAILGIVRDGQAYRVTE